MKIEQVIKQYIYFEFPKHFIIKDMDNLSYNLNAFVLYLNTVFDNCRIQYHMYNPCVSIEAETVEEANEIKDKVLKYLKEKGCN